MENNIVGSVLPFLATSGEHGGGGVREGGDDDLDLGGTSGEHGGGDVREGGDDNLDLGGTSGINFGTGFAFFSNIFDLQPVMLYLQSFKDYWRKESLYCQSIIS